MKAKLAWLAAAASFAVPAHAVILLEVDMTNPAATTITATAGASAITDSNNNYRIALLNFYATSPGGGSGAFLPSSGNLKPTLTNDIYNTVTRLNSNSNLNIIHVPAGFQQSFETGQQAFSGSLTTNLTEGTSFLRTSSYVGDIAVLDSYGQNTGLVVGQYRMTAVPEPATLSALGVGALALLRRKRSR